MATDSHDHAHDHQPPPDEDGPLTYYQTMEIAVRELLIEKGVFGADDVRAAIEAMDARSSARGAEVVAHAWADPAFKDALLGDGTEACAQLGIDIGPTRLIAVENTEAVHNVIVCTLCSCYPRNLLGLPPDWYKAKAYRSRVVREPRAVLREFGTEVSDDVTVRVARFDCRHALHCGAPAARRHRGVGPRTPCRVGDARLPHRRDAAEEPLTPARRRTWAPGGLSLRGIDLDYA